MTCAARYGGVSRLSTGIGVVRVKKAVARASAVAALAVSAVLPAAVLAAPPLVVTPEVVADEQRLQDRVERLRQRIAEMLQRRRQRFDAVAARLRTRQGRLAQIADRLEGLGGSVAQARSHLEDAGTALNEAVQLEAEAVTRFKAVPEAPDRRARFVEARGYAVRARTRLHDSRALTRQAAVELLRVAAKVKEGRQ